MIQFDLICVDCGEAWIYERTTRSGKMPQRCADCKAAHNRAYHRKWRRKNPESSRASKRKWLEKNPEKMAAARAKWERENPERRREFRRERKKIDPIANRAYVRARNARIRSATPIPVPAEKVRQRFEVYGGLCWMCGAEATSIDHVKPISKGGYHMVCNLRPACRTCNSSKGDRWPLKEAM